MTRSLSESESLYLKLLVSRDIASRSLPRDKRKQILTKLARACKNPVDTGRGRSP
jgi:hypothetical protein